ncbi:hypothetical protein MS3_00006431 [Schistosoma haematobium]|uniref:Glutamate--cysteine ligase n=1 Tax=Schistosoma haematobium TaxID=6185 RepID=A0A922IQT3_SCHHA|nr:hypothetical protein MS3_00006431 [Schistosoma haematobium]KAH9585047.1 hypothetical protein MS3_00006431 [Schistosoma haematobium]
MGLLTVGSPLDWPETKKVALFIREQGIKQFLSLYHKLNSRMKHTLKWGDEIEYTLVRIDPSTHAAQLYLGASELLKLINEKKSDISDEITWQPEYAEYMIEGVPRIPFGRLLDAFNTVECNMKKRRLDLVANLPEDCIALTISAFPRKNIYHQMFIIFIMHYDLDWVVITFAIQLPNQLLIVVLPEVCFFQMQLLLKDIHVLSKLNSYLVHNKFP